MTLAFAKRYQDILGRLKPYLVSGPGNLKALNLKPFGVELEKRHIFDPTQARSLNVIRGLFALDAFTFGDQAMQMPRWVFFDCGMFPGIVFGFGQPAGELAPHLKAAFNITPQTPSESFVPLSMWIAIRCAEDGAWFGHNLASANIIAGGAKGNVMPGLATLTKLFGVHLTGATRQYGATQWSTASLNIHLAVGDLRLQGGFTPAHTHPQTLVYCVNVDEARLVAPLQTGWKRETSGGDRFVDADDVDAQKRLHMEIEAGLRPTLVRVERRVGQANRLWLK